MTTSEPAIITDSLSKAFPSYRSGADVLMSMVTSRWRLEQFTALDDVSLRIERGESVGIMGRNGAGKSTLLKILAGTLKQTSGSYEVRGRASAILELGTGFHPDYTGRENIRMGGLCLGMTPGEIADRTESIIDFAELREFIDRPFKTYSSGMQARLTFSVAASIDPEVLIVDEALSAGDALFARKCQRRIREITDSGTTVLLVSHSISTIFGICDRAILMERGRVVEDGHPREVSDAYDRLMIAVEASRPRVATMPTLGTGSTRPTVEVLSARLVDDQGTPIRQVPHGAVCALEVAVESIDATGSFVVGITLQSDQGPKVYSSNTRLIPSDVELEPGKAVIVRFPFRCTLGPGRFYVSGAAKRKGEGVEEDTLLHKLEESSYFDVLAVAGIPFSGVFDLGVDQVEVTVVPSSRSVSGSTECAT